MNQWIGRSLTLPIPPMFTYDIQWSVPNTIRTQFIIIGKHVIFRSHKWRMIKSSFEYLVSSSRIRILNWNKANFSNIEEILRTRSLVESTNLWLTAWGQSEPEVTAWGQSPEVTAWGQSQPEVSAWGQSLPSPFYRHRNVQWLKQKWEGLRKMAEKALLITFIIACFKITVTIW